MSANASIVISAKDNYSSAIKKMQATQTSFRKDLKSLQKELDTLNKNKLTLNMDLSRAKRLVRWVMKRLACGWKLRRRIMITSGKISTW